MIPACAYCGHVDEWNDLVRDVPGKRKPISGDYIICKQCCELIILVVTSEGERSFRKPTDQDKADLRKDKAKTRAVNLAIVEALATRRLKAAAK